MALVNCPECQKEISTRAKTCPNCGCPSSPDENSGDDISKKNTSYTAPIPKTIIRPTGLVLGVLLVIAGGHLLFDYIPQHDPVNINVNNPIDIAKAASGGYYLPSDIEKLKIAAWVVMFLGIVQLATGSIKKINPTLYCRSCDLQVGIKKRFLGNFCERCGQKIKK